jgi:LAO/AO transport system kinase
VDPPALDAGSGDRATEAAAPARLGSAAAAAADLAGRARAGDRRALARLLTEIENRTATAEAALRILYPLAGRAHLVGITGPPGAGKSTLISALIGAVRATGRPVAVLAVDPSSPVTGGAILGDRVRMMDHAGDRDVFIRSMASRGHAGGLATATIAAAAVLDAVGFPVVFLETVGTGQAEVEVAAVADTTLVVEAPGMGDEVQAIKAGLLEVADIVVVTKGDRPGADRTAGRLRAMLGPAPAVAVGGAGSADEPAGGRPTPGRPEVLVTAATNGAGVPELLGAIDRRAAALGARGAGSEGARLARARAQLEGIVAERIQARILTATRTAETEALLRAIAAHEIDPYAAADRVIAVLDSAPGV